MVHEVKFMVPKRPLGKQAIKFDVKVDEGMLGTLKVSRAGVEWRPRNATYGYPYSWEKFDEIMKEHQP